MGRTTRRATVVLALAPLLSVSAGTAAYAGLGVTGDNTSTVSIPAPDGDASAVAAEISGILTIGKTTAHAGSGGGSATADALDLLGTRVAGGDQNGVGHKEGNLIGTGDTPLGDAEVAPWSAKVTDDGDGYQAMAEAALAHVNLADVLEIFLLHSKSSAAWSPDASSGDAESDGAEVNLADMLDVKVLHSEAHSNGKGKSVLVVVNGSDIGSSDQVNGACELDLSPVIDLLCLTAGGGTGSNGTTSSDATVGGIDVGDGALTGTVSGTKSSGATTSVQGEKQTQHQQRNERGPLPHTEGPNGAGKAAGGLPFTGADTSRLVAVAMAFAALGGAMLAWARRRRTAFGG